MNPVEVSTSVGNHKPKSWMGEATQMEQSEEGAPAGTSSHRHLPLQYSESLTGCGAELPQSQCSGSAWLG